MKKQLSGLLACMLSLSMAVSVLPASVYAAGADPAVTESVSESAVTAETEETVEEAAVPDTETTVTEEPAAEMEPAGAENVYPEKEPALSGTDESVTPEESAAAEAEEETVSKSAAAEAAGDEDLPENKTVEAVKPAEIVTGTSVDIADNAELFAGYVKEQFYGPAAVSGGKLKARRVLQREKLTDSEKLAYDYIHTKITDIAAGYQAETSFSIPLEDLGLEQIYYTAEDLELDNLLNDQGKPTAEAVAKVFELVQFQISNVMDALAADCPYELYWYDKTSGYRHSSCSYGDYSDGTPYVCLSDEYMVAMSVAQAYAPEPYNVEDYTADTTKTGAARTAVEKAEEILADYRSSSDYDKLLGYKDAICGMVSYNDEAAADHNTPYGDPWQMIYVFDGDESTNVVCEGYSKAFQYLCDQSDFKGEVTCNSMSGHMDGGTGAGAHMWNVVSIGGQNYLADITNVDEDSVGARGSKLFLAGTDIDSDASGYTFQWDDETEGNTTYYGATVSYQYDAETIAQYSEEERIIAVENFDPSAYEEPEQEPLTLNGTEPDYYADDVYTVPGAEVTLDPKASAGTALSYKWYEDDDVDAPVILSTDQTYTFAVHKSNYSITCHVTSASGEEGRAYFHVHAEGDNELRVYPEGGSEDDGYLNLEPEAGKEVTLKVNASAADETNLTYEWYTVNDSGDEEVIEGTVSDTYIFTPDRNGSWYCRVEDGYGNGSEIEFFISIQNHLEIQFENADEGTIYAEPGEELTLSTNTTAIDTNGFVYQWRDDAYQMIEGADQGSFIVTPQHNGSYYCQVTDKYGNTAEASVYVDINNDLSVASADEGKTTYYVSPGTEVNLQAAVSAKDTTGITWRWEGSGVTGDAATDTDSYTVTVDSYKYLTCYVYDKYGNTDYINFYLYVDNHFDVAAAGSTNITIDPGQEITLAVQATADDPSGITYQWSDAHYNTVEGATAASYTFKPDYAGTYRCTVQDQYGSSKTIYFYIKIDSGLTAASADGQSRYGVSSGDSVTLKVAATAKEGTNISYYWYGSGVTGDAAKDTDSYTVTVTEPCSLTCQVSDPYGNYQYVYFTLYVENHFSVKAAGGKTQYTVEPGIQISPGVVVTADNTEGMEYVWRDINGNIIEGANQDSYTFIPARSGWFYCQVTDRYGNTDSIEFYVQIDNGLRAVSADGKTEYGLDYNESVQLRVSATAKDASDLKYSWNGDVSGTAATNTDSYTVKADGPKYVYCEVTDPYGNEVDVSFHVYVENHLSAEAANDETNLRIGAGEEASMQVVVTADDMTGLTCQWYDDNWNEITGATQLTYTVKPDRNDSYICRVEDKYGNQDDVWFYITIDNELRLLSADDGKTTYGVSPNETVTLKVTATAKDTSQLTYHWYGSGVSGNAPTNTDSYTVTADGRKYLSCEVYDQYGNYDEVSFDVYIENHLTAEAVGSTNLTLAYGTETDLEVTASADDPESIRYQWYGPEFDDEAGPETSKISITAEKAGDYHCRVSDAYGNVETVYFYIRIDNQLQAQALNGQSAFHVAKGTKVTLEVDASAASGELTYRWHGDYIDSDAETGKTLEVTVDGYQYYSCEVTDIYGNTAWVSFNVYVENHLVVENADETQELTVALGEEVTLSVTATADDPDSIRYQWYEDWKSEGMPKTASYTFTADHAGWYQCQVSDTYGNEKTVYYRISIDNAFEVSAKGSTEITIAPKEPVTMEVTASAASGTIHYQWYDENDNPIEGATSSSYTIASAQKNCEFNCHVTDDYGNSRAIWFEISIDNEFYAKAKGGITEIYYVKGKAVDLEVEASCKDGELTYQWALGAAEEEDEDGDTYYSYENLLSETAATLHLTDVTDGARYRATVSDAYGNSARIYFELYETEELTVMITGSTTILPGEETVLAVRAVSDDQTTPITYQWYQRDNEKETYSLLEGRTESQLTVKPSETTRYRCRVQQGVQVVRSDVTVYVETDLWARAEKELIETTAGKEEKLSVNAETNAASLTYQWYKSEVKDANRLTETGAELTITAEAGTNGYICVVSDGYETRTITFTVVADETIPSPVRKADAITLTENQLQTVKIPAEEYVWLKFTPASDGIYQFASDGYADTRGSLDSEDTETWNSEEDDYGNFMFEADLTKDTTYYLRVSEENDDPAVTSVVVKRLRDTSHLEVGAKDGKYEYSVKPDEKVTLEVVATADTALTYHWSMWDYTTDKEVEIPSCTTGLYTIEAPVNATYYCRVEDTFGNQKSVYFYVYVDTELSAESVDGITTHYVLPGEDLTLEVKAESSEDDPLTYEWIRYDLDTGESTVLQNTDASLSLADIDTSANYRVYVRDAYHNTSSVYYSVILTAKLELEYNGRITVKPGQDAVLSVKAVKSDQTTPVTYQWSVYDDENDVYTDLVGETGSTLTVKEIRKNSLDYRCKATQGTRSRTADFYITVDSGFEMHTDNQTIMGKAGETVSLPVEASTEGGTLVYTWYQDVNGTETLIENESGAQLSVTVPETSAKYICKVADGYASDRVRFSVWNQEVISDGPAPDQAIEIKVNETKYVNISSGGAYLKFVPEQTDTYDFWSVGNEDTWAELLDQDRNQIVYNDDQEDDSNFKLSEELTAGQTYYYHVRYYSKNRTGIIEVKLAENCEHVWDAGVVTKAATCEEDGIMTYTCKNNSSHTYTEVIPATGHHLVKTDAKEATCETDGNIEYYTCSNCSKVFADKDGKTTIQLADTVLKAPGHDWSEPVWGEWKEEGDTWTIDVSFTCSRCKEEKKPEVTVEKTKDEAATAENPGETVYTATTVFNGETYTTMKTITTQPIGHNFGGEPTWAWTESGDSYTAAAVFKCTDEGCDKELTIDADVIVKEKEDPTCEKAGSITYEATVTFDEKTYTAEKVVDVEALSHDLTKTEEVAATCETDGNIAYYTCSVCKKLFSDEAGTTEITQEATVIKALVHDWDGGEITTKPTCTDPGVKTYTCKHDNTHTYTEPIPASGHTMTKTEAVPATCEEAGNIEYYTCSVCSKLFEDADGTKEISSIEKTVVEALGHEWDEGIVTTEPTDTTPGVRTYTCKHDPSHHKTEEIITDAYKQYQADKTEADKVAADLTAIADTIAAAENLSSLTGTNAAFVTAVKNAYASYSKLSAAQKAILQETQPDLVSQLEKANAKITELEKQQKTEEDTKKQQEEAAKKQAEAAAKAAAQAKQAALAKEAAAEEAAGHKTVEATDKAITTMRSDADPSNSVYGTLSARVTKPKKNALKIQWNKVSGAAGYIVYANKCGAGNHYVKIAELNSASAASYNLTKINGKNLTKNTYYKILIASYKNSSTGKRVIAMARTIHVATSGGKNGNPTKLTLNKKKVSVKVKKKFKLTAKQTGKSGTKIKKHRAVMFESSDPRIATVTKKGVIKGVKKGKCYIYVYAQNGLFKKVKVTVK